MRRAGLAFAAAIMAAGTLTACGGGDDFCDVGGDVENFSPDNIDEAKGVMDDAVDAAPDEIKDDVETLRDFIDSYDKDNPEASMEGAEDVAPAAENVTDYMSENCD